MDKRCKKGFTDEEISQVKLIAERTDIHLDEIMKYSLNAICKEEGISPYLKISKAYDIDEAVSFMMMFEQELGSIIKALDEYLLTIQIKDIDSRMLSEDKSRYETVKKRCMPEQAITGAMIEEKMLKFLRNSLKEDMKNAFDEFNAACTQLSDLETPQKPIVLEVPEEKSGLEGKPHETGKKNKKKD